MKTVIRCLESSGRTDFFSGLLYGFKLNRTYLMMNSREAWITKNVKVSLNFSPRIIRFIWLREAIQPEKLEIVNLTLSNGFATTKGCMYFTPHKTHDDWNCGIAFATICSALNGLKNTSVNNFFALKEWKKSGISVGNEKFEQNILEMFALDLNVRQFKENISKYRLNTAFSRLESVLSWISVCKIF